MSEYMYFSCPWAGCTDKTKFQECRLLLSHMYLMHPAGERSHIFCGINGCQNVCSTTDSYRKHINRFHSETVQRTVAISSTTSSSTSSDLPCSGHTVHETMVVESNVTESDLDHMLSSLSRRMLLFALKVREQFILPKSTFVSIMSDVKEIVNFYHGYVCDTLQAGHSRSSDSEDDLQFFTDSSILDSMWGAIETDAKLKKNCNSMLNLIEPEEVVLGYNCESGKKETYQYISVVKSLTHYLSHEDVWASINASNVRDEHVLRDYTDGLNFCSHRYFVNNPEALRLHFYVDDFEVCNPLGSARSKHKLTAVYYYVGNVEKCFTSSLRCIHVALLVRSALVKNYGYEKVFERLIADIHVLEEEGIALNISGMEISVFASVATFSADNLGSHQIGGFRMSFSSGRVCRQCMICYNEISSYVSENDPGFPNIRTSSVHQTHVQSVVQDSSLASVYGVNGPCALQSLRSFDAVTCLPPDAMHDFLEGLVPLSLTSVLDHLIQQSKAAITVSVINNRLSRLQLAPADRTNAPPLLPNTFPKRSLLGTASQMWVLLRILPFVIGDLVNEADDVWEIYLLLRQIFDIVFAPSVHETWLAVLQQLIAEHHSLLIQLCHVRLTPKCHFITHYPRLIAAFGPLRHVWCMRFEAYHQYFKTLANSIGNFKNIAKTLAERNQMKKCFEQASSMCLEAPVDCCDVKNHITVTVLPACIQTDVASYFGCRPTDNVLQVKKFVSRSVEYTAGDYFVVNTVHEDIPVFLNVKFILSREEIWCIVGRVFICDAYIRHYHAYSVKDSGRWLFSAPGFEKDFHSYQPYSVFIDGKERKLISLRHKLLPTNVSTHVI